MSSSHAFHRRAFGLSGIVVIVTALGTLFPALADHAVHPLEIAFLNENDDAMAKMMTAMSIKPTGDIDRDFVAMMEPHHQGAIDMAQAVLRYGRNEQIRRIAQGIIVDQLQEIAAMRLAVGEPLPPSGASPTASGDPVGIVPAKSSMPMPELKSKP
jgi:hypothetical protein